VFLRLRPLATERVPLHNAAGRILAEPITADRDSPAIDVSAMDGYSVRLADLAAGFVE
jgi:molybdopterin molybdotransferase